ncbi:dipeptide ABC transporter ATP-binding protein [Zhihengliuella salsuginis]|uniref:ABC transporter ATP-binding protein n=1 Tax=Zhihengliuella salsuginis TaxID=578222 RepID=A0ABQ3GKV1_9MICC|nr:ABC transporter ATP-binding protein [Zhihengliuella salsuginis]GHD09290.1 ABC transporter ATP-binding protein [Zhihengliuella salsuginis]
MTAPTPAPLVDVRGLTVSFGGGAPVVSGLDLSVAPGESVALVGESGSGKSVTARALLGLADGGRGGGRARVTADAFRIAGHDLRGRDGRVAAPAGLWRRIRGGDVALVLQDALTSLDPLRPVGREIDDALRLHTRLSPTGRAARVRELLAAVGLSGDGTDTGALRPGALSGGMRQRALIAAGLSGAPKLLIADEPTTALDATVAARILDLLADLRAPADGSPAAGMGQLLISHDLAVVSRVAEKVLVMRAGEVVESGPTAEVLADPQHEYTRMLLAAVPAGKPRGTRLCLPGATGTTAPPPPAARATPPAPAPTPATAAGAAADPALEAAGLVKMFTRRDEAGRAVAFRAVDDVSFSLAAGTTLGIVGESGSGKTTTARMALGLTDPDAGRVDLFGAPFAGDRGDGHPVAEAARRPRRPQLGAVYQDPLSSFDPRMSVGALLADAVSGGRTRRAGAHRRRIGELLDMVGLDAGASARHPRSLSGGQRQRVAIARALAPGPRVLICDEPVSALDVSVQAQILDLLDDLQRDLGLSYLFISHDLAVVRHVSDQLLVMRGGRVVESGETEQVFSDPQEQYTRDLLAASPALRAAAPGD